MRWRGIGSRRGVRGADGCRRAVALAWRGARGYVCNNTAASALQVT